MILPKESATFSSCRFNFFRANKICFLSRTRVDSMSMYDNVKSDIAKNCDEDYPTPRISWALFALFISHVARYAPSSQDKNHLKLYGLDVNIYCRTGSKSQMLHYTKSARPVGAGTLK